VRNQRLSSVVDADHHETAIARTSHRLLYRKTGQNVKGMNNEKDPHNYADNRLIL
jgi:hypothetical protein